jgi:hypothetical protein
MALTGSSVEIHVVEVTTDDLVRSVPKKQLWLAAAPPDQAVQLVLAAIPEGWAVQFADGYLTTKEVELLKMSAGEVRKLTK